MCLICVCVFRERLWQEYERTGELLVDLGSDQTSLHNPFSGGYYPVQLSFTQANQLMNTDTQRFRDTVHERYTHTYYIQHTTFKLNTAIMRSVHM